MGPPTRIRVDAKETSKPRGFTRFSPHFVRKITYETGDRRQETGDQVSIHLAFFSR